MPRKAIAFALFLVGASVVLLIAPSSFARSDSEQILTIDHYVPHISTAPAIAGLPIQLYVRQRVLADGAADLPGAGRVVLFVHGATLPSANSFDLRFKDYSWMAYLAAAGFDVFAMDMTGYGWSTRPAPMDDPCNVSQQQQQQFLMPSPLADSCQASFPFLMTDRPSQWDDVDAVVDYIRALKGAERVSLVGWSGGGARFGGYAGLRAEKLDVMVLLAPSYARSSPTDPPAERPEPGLPMNVASPLARDGGVISGRELACGNRYEPGFNEAFAASNAEFDNVGATWGSGVVRGPTTGEWGWNSQLAAKVTVPTLLMSGEFDDQVAPQLVRDLYQDLGTPRKVFLELACTGHRAQFQSRYRIVQDASLDWLLHGSLDGLQAGVLRKGD